jgi:hypothetical protein
MHTIIRRPDRRSVLAGSLALLAGGSPALAQRSPLLSDAKLARIIAEAMQDAPGIRLARPAILGFTQADVVIRQTSRATSTPGTNYHFAIVVPEVEDGLLLFRGTETPKWFVMHRTGRHLRRIISARNVDGNLSEWTGQPADRDLVSQLEFWEREG